MRKLAFGVMVLSCVFAFVERAAAIQNPIIQEVTFDDDQTNSGGLIKSVEMRATDPTHFWIMNFVGTAKRSDITGPTAGRYGRGAQFDGDPNSGIAITRLNRPDPPNAPNDTSFRLLLWVKPTTAGGEIFRANSSFAVKLNNEGNVVIRDEDTTPHVYTTSLSIPNGAFHHLWIEYDDVNEDVTVQVDFGDRVPVPWVGPMAEWVPGTQTGIGSMGSGFSGVLDELLVTKITGVSESELKFDRNPSNCPSGLSCAEYSLNVFPRDWPPPPLPALEVPVRYKAVYKSTGSTACTSSNPCPLLVLISGGGACGDDYSYLYEVIAYAQQRFFVVTVDPNCEYGYPWLQFPHETSQLIAATTHAQTGPLQSLIQDGDYYASGCSHGAQAVALWLLSEPIDHPKRAFARSANYAAHCTYHMQVGPRCVPTQKSLDQVTCGSCNDPSPHDHGDNTDQEGCIESQWGVINKVDSTAVQQRELGAIWGGPDPTKIPLDCECPGAGCAESIEGNDLGGRLMRVTWREKEDQNPPGTPRTGWFWEWNDTCTHCPWNNTDIPRCSACFLRHGYDAMKNIEGCTDCDNKDEGPAPFAACPAEWGLPGGGSNLPCDEQAPVPGNCSTMNAAPGSKRP